MTEEAKKVFWDIIKCPQISCGCSDDNPCRAIIAYQNQKEFAQNHWQVPEPWNGKIETARVLFLLSNPACSSKEVYPDYPMHVPSFKKSLSGNGWKPSDIEAFFECRFNSKDNEGRGYVENLKVLTTNGGRDKRVRTWNALCRYAFAIIYGNKIKHGSILNKDKKKGLVSELAVDNTYTITDKRGDHTEYTIRPGVDFAITEIVKCKSKKEEGVSSAMAKCVGLYLDRVLSLFKGDTICVAGKMAKNVFLDSYKIVDPMDVNCDNGIYLVNGRNINVIFVPHPAAFLRGKYKNGFFINGIRVL